MNSLLMTIVHMALVYGILYFILPRYLSKNKNQFITTVMLVMFIAVVACFNYLNFLLTFYTSTRMGFFDKMPGIDFIIPIWARQIIFNYPTVVGFAVAIKLLKRWYLKQKETEELTRGKINAELILLKAQVHPHFLFNTLNNIYSFILNGSPKAPGMIKKLSGLLNYFLNECNHTLVPLQKEILMIQDYMALEKIRYGDSLSMSLHIHGNVGNKLISPLLLIPFVENSFKHGTSRMLTHPWVTLEINIEKDSLEFKLSNNKPDSNNEVPSKKGLGLNNVKKRLQILYPDTHSLHIVENAMSYDVAMKLVLHTPAEKQNNIHITKEKKIYELA
ncbi:MAG: hypothetical protein JWN83_1169 [Chitinophagaceae bacterium]|nr:hypothetical protein [Chitinophagaceae bacterium]